jgi:hypothetical protein
MSREEAVENVMQLVVDVVWKFRLVKIKCMPKFGSSQDKFMGQERKSLLPIQVQVIIKFRYYNYAPGHLTYACVRVYHWVHNGSIVHNLLFQNE